MHRNEHSPPLTFLGPREVFQCHRGINQQITEKLSECSFYFKRNSNITCTKQWVKWLCSMHSCILLNGLSRSGFSFHTPTASLSHSLVSRQTCSSPLYSLLYACLLLHVFLPLLGFPSALCFPAEPLLILHNLIQKSPSDLCFPISPRVGCPSTVWLWPCIHTL